MAHISKKPRKVRKVRFSLAAAAVLCGWLGALVPILLGGSWWWLLLPAAVMAGAHPILHRPGAVPVFTYHSVSDRDDWLPWAPNIAISSDLFARHLDVLARCGARVIPTTELVAARLAGRPVPDRAVVLHLDDGYLDNWVAAYPALKKHRMPATIFVSADFIDPGAGLRPNLEDVEAGRVGREALQWEGYLNADELRALQASGLVDIQSHGTDHARVFTGPEVIGTLTEENWRNLAWVQWGATAGDKSGWHRLDRPVAVPLGSPVRRNGPALTSRAWLGDRVETPEEYSARSLGTLRRAREDLSRVLGREISVFCWPQNRSTIRSRDLAYQAGFTATTGGWEENRPGQDGRVISRVHVGKDVLGLACPRADRLYFRAQVHVGWGSYYWYGLIFAIDIIRKGVFLFRAEPMKSQP
ncbi:MAG: polysaccharide deacetylase family protein [bacterium]